MKYFVSFLFFINSIFYSSENENGLNRKLDEKKMNEKMQLKQVNKSWRKNLGKIKKNIKFENFLNIRALPKLIN